MDQFVEFSIEDVDFTTDRAKDIFDSIILDDVLEDMGIQTVQKRTNACYNCGSLDFIEDTINGMIVCPCGQVIDDIIEMDAEGFNNDDGMHSRCTMVHNKLLPQSSLGTSVNVSGKLRKLQIWCSMPYRERSNNLVYKQIDEVCDLRRIPKIASYDAKLICKKVNSKQHVKNGNIGKTIITRGRNRSGIIAGALLIACRKNNVTRSSREMATYFGIEEADVNKGQSKVMMMLRGDPVIRDFGTTNVSDFIERKCIEMRIRNAYVGKAVTISKNIEKLGMASNHTPYAVAAASILLMADIEGLTHITKKMLSRHFSSLTDVTIGKTYNEFQHRREILVSDAITDNIMKRINEKRKHRTITKEVAQKMRDFGVSTDKYIIEGEEHLFDQSKAVASDDDNETEDSSHTNYTDCTNDADITKRHDGDDEFTIEDMRDIVREIKQQLDAEQYADAEQYQQYLEESRESREMVIEYILDYPETLSIEDFDREFFKNVICDGSDKLDEIAALIKAAKPKITKKTKVSL